MTSQEESMLNDLMRKINSTSLQEKDDSAERLLRDGLGRNPDAMYMLAQTVLVQNMALDQARQQIMSLQQAPQQQQPAKATSFLGSLLGHRDPQPQQPQSQGYQTVNYGQQQPVQSQFSQPLQQAPSGQPSFMRSAATTAAGVAAGALAFQGVESLLHGGGGGGFGGGGFGGGGFGGGNFSGGGFGEAPREEVINNYYDSPGGGSGQGMDEQPQGSFDNSAQDSGSSYGDDFSDGGGDFGGDDLS